MDQDTSAISQPSGYLVSQDGECTTRNSEHVAESGATVTFLLRKPEVFDNNETIQKYIGEGKARLVKGDALVKDDVRRAWAESSAGDDGAPVELLIFTVGELGFLSWEFFHELNGHPGPTNGKFHITKGFLISPENLITQAILNVLETLPASQPKIIAISSIGVTAASRKALTFFLWALYGYLLPQAHRDKRGAEQIYAHIAGFSWDTKDNVGPDILEENWMARVPPQGQYKNLVIIRPAMLTDGPSLADKHPEKEAYRVQDDDVSGAYTISRRDVSHFLVEKVVKHWDSWSGRRVSIAY